MLRYLEDESGEVRQAASYGIGVMATSAGEEYPDVIKGMKQADLLRGIDCSSRTTFHTCWQ